MLIRFTLEKIIFLETYRRFKVGLIHLDIGFLYIKQNLCLLDEKSLSDRRSSTLVFLFSVALFSRLPLHSFLQNRKDGAAFISIWCTTSEEETTYTFRRDWPLSSHEEMPLCCMGLSESPEVLVVPWLQGCFPTVLGPSVVRERLGLAKLLLRKSPLVEFPCDAFSPQILSFSSQSQLNTCKEKIVRIICSSALQVTLAFVTIQPKSKQLNGEQGWLRCVSICLLYLA